MHKKLAQYRMEAAIRKNRIYKVERNWSRGGTGIAGGNNTVSWKIESEQQEREWQLDGQP
jgi:hypothetical protein